MLKFIKIFLSLILLSVKTYSQVKENCFFKETIEKTSCLSFFDNARFIFLTKFINNNSFFLTSKRDSLYAGELYFDLKGKSYKIKYSKYVNKTVQRNSEIAELINHISDQQFNVAIARTASFDYFCTYNGKCFYYNMSKLRDSKYEKWIEELEIVILAALKIN